MTRKRLFCYACGRVTEELVEGKCSSCFFKGVELVRLSEKPKARVCMECLRHLSRGKWQGGRGSVSHALEQAAKSSLEEALPRIDIEALRKDYSFGEVEHVSPKKCYIPYVLRVAGVYKGLEYSEIKKGKVGISLTLCDDCSRRKGGYYEAVLQLRVDGEGLDEDVTAELERIMHDLQVKDSRAFVSDFKTVKKGVDIYVGSMGAARKAAKALADKFGGEIKESPKLVGRSRDGKDLYRVSISLRLSKFKRDDILLRGNRKLQVLEVSRDKITAYDLRKRKKVILSLKNLHRAVVLKEK